MNKKSRRFVLETNFIKIANKYKLSLHEFLLLMYFDNEENPTFNIQSVCKNLSLDENTAMEIFSSLIQKNLIEIVVQKNEQNKMIEFVNLNNFYENVLVEDKKNAEDKIKHELFRMFEEEFGRDLTVVDADLIKMWIEKCYSKNLIEVAIKEAKCNDTCNLRYIDKILHDWEKQGLKSEEDVYVKTKRRERVFEDNDILNYNWLENE